MNSKVAVLISLFVISVTTLLLAVFGDNAALFSITTIIAHIALVFFGYSYASSKHKAFIKEVRKDIFGK